MSFGVLPTGFSRPTVAQLRQQVVDDIHANIGPLVDCSPDSDFGKLIDVKVRQLDQVWSGMQATYNARDPDQATGDALNSIAKMTGTERQAATFSTVALDVGLDAGTTLETGVHFVSVSGSPDVRFTLSESVGSFTSPSTTTYTLAFRAENTGPVAAPAHSLTVIATPIRGWTSADNALDAVEGSPIADDPTLRTRRDDEIAAVGSCTDPAIKAHVLEVTNVQSVTVFENFGAFVDSMGLPPGSFEVLLWDGATPAADDDTIAQAIWDNKPAGIRPFGTGSSGTAKDRDPVTGAATGASHTVEFSRVAQAEIWITVQLTTTTGYPGNTTFAADLAEAANKFFKTAGVTIVAERLKVFALAVPGVVDVVLLEFDTSASPTNTANLPLGPRQLPRFDSTRVTVL